MAEIFDPPQGGLLHYTAWEKFVGATASTYKRQTPENRNIPAKVDELGVTRQQRLNFLPQPGIVCGGLSDVGRALLRRQAQCGGKNGFFAFGRVHG